eukprot:scaffold468_cov133-Skeletonema_menzelii.AAC.7
MAEGARDDDDEIFVYMGGNQQVPDGVRRARIHKSVKIVPKRAFYNRRQSFSNSRMKRVINQCSC